MDVIQELIGEQRDMEISVCLQQVLKAMEILLQRLKVIELSSQVLSDVNASLESKIDALEYRVSVLESLNSE